MASMSLQTSDYAAVSQKENDDESPDTPNDNQRRLRTLKSTVTPWIAHALLAAVNIFTFFYLLHMSPSQTRCAKLLSSWCMRMAIAPLPSEQSFELIYGQHLLSMRTSFSTRPYLLTEAMRIRINSRVSLRRRLMTPGGTSPLLCQV